VVSHVGAALLRMLADRAGLTGALAADFDELRIVMRCICEVDRGPLPFLAGAKSSPSRGVRARRG
jgi:hypothetical protein